MRERGRESEKEGVRGGDRSGEEVCERERVHHLERAMGRKAM